MAITPLKLTLYNPETNEVEKEFSRAFIPTGIFTELVKLMKAVDLKHPEKLEPETADSLYALISELFGNQITIDQIKKGTDLGEFMVLFATIMSRVEGEVSQPNPTNPTMPGQISRKRHK